MNDLHDDETRITDKNTGGQKGRKLTQLGALDPVALIEVARVAGMGANKYAAHNFLKGYDWSLSYNAMMRHALLFWAGEDDDPESGLSHMGHVAWMALCLISFQRRAIGTDDRPPSAFEGPATLTQSAAFRRAHAERFIPPTDVDYDAYIDMLTGFGVDLGIDRPPMASVTPVRSVLFSEGVLEFIAETVGVEMEWGEPNPDGSYTPTFTIPATPNEVIEVPKSEASDFIERDGVTYAPVCLIPGCPCDGQHADLGGEG